MHLVVSEYNALKRKLMNSSPSQILDLLMRTIRQWNGCFYCMHIRCKIKSTGQQILPFCFSSRDVKISF